jgi:hydroxymethylbilane synthase
MGTVGLVRRGLRKARRMVVGTRGSQLALAQAQLVVDRRVFVKELEEALLARRIDAAVHSLKDMPTEVGPGLELVAVVERTDARDVLVSTSGRGIRDLAPGAVVGTGSRRRAVQLRTLRSDLEIRDIRGNVDTRLRKCSRGEFNGVVVAAAALLRLGLQDRIAEYLMPEDCLPAVGQGILGVEIREADGERAELTKPLNHEPTWKCAVAERAFLRRLGGGCRAPIAALAEVKGDTLVLQGMVADMEGSQILRDSIEDSVEAADELGIRLAEKMLERGASELVTQL